MNKSIILFCSLLTILLTQCQKEQINQSKTDIYVGGYLSSNGKIESAYWKNGTADVLSTSSEDSIDYNGSKTIGNYINAVRISGGSIYAGGAEVVNGYSVAKIWKDGVAILLSNGASNSSVNDFVVSGNDIYAVGDDYINGQVQAKYWKNGDGTTLSTNGETTCVFLNGTDVYVGGYEFVNDNWGRPIIPLGVYWKNGEKIILTDTTDAGTAGYGYIWNGTVSGNDVYFVGEVSKGYHQNNIGKYWKNGTPVVVTDGSYDVLFYDIKVYNNDIYIAGIALNENKKWVASYWKNGTKIELGDGSINSFALSIAIDKNGNIYVSGQEDGNSSIIWKNGNVIYKSSNSWFSKMTLVE